MRPAGSAIALAQFSAQAEDVLGVSGIRWRRSAIGRLITRALARSDTIHFLHIGKTAGTQIREVLGSRILSHGHDVTLAELPARCRYFFSIRQPESRFVSGFYSRKRQGQPRYFFPWSTEEQRAFSEFEHANDLAEALYERPEALEAITSIRHTAQHQIDWFVRHGQIFDLHPPVWIVRQEQFEVDFDEFCRRAGLGRVPLPPSRSHANDYSTVPPLSAKASKNLRRWYSRDLAFYEACEQWMAREDDARNKGR
jgi:hypothetical protein